jgi:ubiquinone/menaquinone biosynthesis C-methylase UbiE
MSLSAKIREDFDRIALTETGGWNHNTHYHRFLLSRLPLHMISALDIGCGTGEFSRRLGERSDHVLGIDLSPLMIQIARERLVSQSNIAFQVADVMACELPDEEFDCIVSIATLHHLAFGPALEKMTHALRPQGMLLVLDLYRSHGLVDWLTSATAIPANWGFMLAHRSRPKSPEARAAWKEHSRRDHYMTLPQIRQACSSMLPGAEITRHFFWRYSIVWRKGG